MDGIDLALRDQRADSFSIGSFGSQVDLRRVTSFTTLNFAQPNGLAKM